MRGHLGMGCPEIIDLGASERVGLDPVTAKTPLIVSTMRNDSSGTLFNDQN